MSIQKHRLSSLLALCACGLTSCDEPPAAPPRTTTTQPAEDAPPATERHQQAPLPADLERLDPRIAASIRELAERVTTDGAEEWKRLGMLYHGHERVPLARDCYEQALLRDSGDPETWYFLAHAQYHTGDLESAEASLRRVLPLSNYVPARWRLALWLLERGRAEEAREPALDARRAAPEDASAALVLARVHLETDRATDAAELLESVTSDPQTRGYAAFLRATAYRRLGRSAEADAALQGARSSPAWNDPWLERLREGLRHSRADFETALAALHAKDWEKAKLLFEELRGRRPDDPSVLQNLSLVYWELKELAPCAEVLERLLQAEPSDRNLHIRLATVYRDRAQQAESTRQKEEWTARALKYVRRADTLQPAPDSAAMEGSVLAAAGKAAEAAAAFVEAARREAEQSPRRPRYLMRAAKLYRSAGNLLQAIEIMDQLHAVLPETFERTHALAILKVQASRFDEARELLARALELKPNDSRALETLRKLEEYERAGGQGIRPREVEER